MMPIDLSGLELRDPEGVPVRLGEVVDRPTVVDVVRYYGCAPCRSYLMSLADLHGEITAEGGAVLGIGPAAAYQARLLGQRRRVPFPLLLDPDHQVRDALGLDRQRLVAWLTDVGAWGRWARAALSAGQGLVTGGWWEVPAVAVLDGGSIVRWLHRGRSMGDYPPIDQPLAALRDLLGKEQTPSRR